MVIKVMGSPNLPMFVILYRGFNVTMVVSWLMNSACKVADGSVSVEGQARLPKPLGS